MSSPPLGVAPGTSLNTLYTGLWFVPDAATATAVAARSGVNTGGAPFVAGFFFFNGVQGANTTAKLEISSTPSSAGTRIAYNGSTLGLFAPSPVVAATAAVLLVLALRSDVLVVGTDVAGGACVVPSSTELEVLVVEAITTSAAWDVVVGAVTVEVDVVVVDVVVVVLSVAVDVDVVLVVTDVAVAVVVVAVAVVVVVVEVVVVADVDGLHMTA